MLGLKRLQGFLELLLLRLQKIVSRLAFLGVVIAQEDLNSKFLSSLPPEWNTHVVVWMKKLEVDTMSIDDLYNNFKIVEQKVKKSIGASSGAQNLAFMTAPSTSSTNDVNTASPQVSTARLSDNAVYAFMVENPNGFDLLHQDLEQIREDDLEAMDLKWQLSLLSMRAKRYYQRTCKKIFINTNDTARYDKSKVECFNCHKMGHFARECRAPRSKEEEHVQTNMALMAFSDSELNQTEFTATTYKRGLATLEEQLITYRKNEVLFSEEVAVLKREVACKDYEINVLKIPPPHPLIYNRPNKLDLSYSGLDEFKELEFKGYGTKNSKQESNIFCDKKSDDSKKSSDDSLVKEQVSKDTSSFVESSLNVDKETIFPVDKKISRNLMEVMLHLEEEHMVVELFEGRPMMFVCSKERMKGHLTSDKSVKHIGKSKEVGTLRYLSLVVPLKKVGDEAVHKELGDRMKRAATTASSLEAEQDSGNIK
ncbi:putative ribonuclease H-like domain-containing protein [Tanacetum coccineum]